MTETSNKTSPSCSHCRKPKATLSCGVCQEDLCKTCAEFLDAATFSFLPEIPASLGHTYYCPTCFSSEVEPKRAEYDEIMERAREVYIFFTTQRKPLPILMSSKQRVRVLTCEDRDETILRLAFLAAQQGYNGVIQTEVKSEKIRNQAYEKTAWSGSGLPANLDAQKLERHQR